MATPAMILLSQLTDMEAKVTKTCGPSEPGEPPLRELGRKRYNRRKLGDLVQGNVHD